jgi:peptidyl-prolyl cis-trans isomerase D
LRALPAPICAGLPLPETKPMLSFFRRGGAAQILGGAIVFAIILVFALEFRPGRRGAAARLSQECTVGVVDRCVDEKEFIAAYRLMAPPGIEARELKRIRLRSHVLSGLVERELLLREAERFGIEISEKETDERLARGEAQVSVPVAYAEELSYQLGLCPRPRSPLVRGCEPGAPLGVRLLPVRSSKTGKFDYKKYERVIRTTTNRGAKEFKEMQRRELIAERMRQLVRSRVRVPHSEAFSAYERQNSRAVVRIVDIKRDWFAKYVVDASDAAVDAWALQNSEQVDSAWEASKEQFQAGCPLVSELFAEVLPGSSDEDKVVIREKVDQALVRIRGGEDFAQVARDSSDGRTAIIGGELGCLGKEYGEGHEELAAGLRGLKPGELSVVLETKRGFHVLKYHGKLAQADVEQVGRRHVARLLSVRFQADALAREFAEQLIQQAQDGTELAKATDELARQYARGQPGPPKSKRAGKVDPEAKPAGLDVPDRPKVEISAPFAVTSNPIRNALPAESPAASAFALNKPDDIHPVPIVTHDGVAVMQLKEKNMATREDFEKNRSSILAKLRAAKAADALARYVARLRSAAEDEIMVVAEPDEQQKPGEESGDEE